MSTESWPPNRRYTESEWNALEEQFPRGMPVTGTVVVRCMYGVWVRVDQFPDVKALLEVIQFADPNDPDRRFTYPADYPEVGSRVEAVVAGWRHPSVGAKLHSLEWQEVHLSQRPLPEVTP